MSGIKPAIGIDFGTSGCRIAIYRNNSPEIIPNSLGKNETPSCVAFTPYERLIGKIAIDQSDNNPQNTIFAAKRLIGRKYDDQIVKNEIPLCVTKSEGQLKIKVKYMNEDVTFFPEQISAILLEKLKYDAEKHLRTKIRDVVISCPAFFNDEQRQGLTTAANIAGLNVLRMINEPTAVALASAVNADHVGRNNVLICDFGGGFFDVSILTIQDKAYRVCAIKGDTHLGGEDIDLKMVKFFLVEFQKKIKKDISADKKLWRILKKKCEAAKIILSTKTQATVALSGYTNSRTTITRDQFNELNKDLFDKIINLVSQTLADAKMPKRAINKVILVGGSSRIPRVQELLQEYFNGKTLDTSLNTGEACAYGAAIQAELLRDQPSPTLRGISLCDICPLSLGIELIDESFSVIIPRNTPIPVKIVKPFFTTFDNQTWTVVEIFEGERAVARANHFLGHFALDGIPPGPRGVSINVEFEIDENGILHASAIEPKTGTSSKITIMSDTRLSKDDAQRALKIAEQMQEQDHMYRERFSALDGFQRYCIEIQNEAQNITETKREAILKKVDEMLEWVHHNRYSNKEEIEAKKSELKAFYNATRSKQ